MLLPNLNQYEEGKENFEVVGEDEGYTPTLYKYDEDWHLDWVGSEDGDSLVDFTGDTPTEATAKAFNFCKEKGFID